MTAQMKFISDYNCKNWRRKSGGRAQCRSRGKINTKNKAEILWRSESGSMMEKVKSDRKKVKPILIFASQNLQSLPAFEWRGKIQFSHGENVNFRLWILRRKNWLCYAGCEKF
jgi:hypothetical protein